MWHAYVCWVCVEAHVCMRVYIYAWMCVRVCSARDVRACTCERLFVYAHVCVRVCVFMCIRVCSLGVCCMRAGFLIQTRASQELMMA